MSKKNNLYEEDLDLIKVSTGATAVKGGIKEIKTTVFQSNDKTVTLRFNDEPSTHPFRKMEKGDCGNTKVHFTIEIPTSRQTTIKEHVKKEEK